MNLKIKILTMLALILAAIALNAKPVTNPGVTLSYQLNKGGTIEIELKTGDIIIETWQKNEVLLKLNDDGNENPITTKQANNTLYISDRKDLAGYISDLRLTVPKEININIKTNYGDIIIKDDIAGDVNISTSGGNVKLSNLNGNLQVHSSGGDIRMGDISGKVNVNTDGGDITIRELGNKDSKISTNGGNITVKSSLGRVTITTSGGDIKSDELKSGGDIVTSGGEISLGNTKGDFNISTSGGDVSLKSSNGNLTVATSGGDLKLFDMSGTINAKTSSGNIYCELNPKNSGKSSLVSGYGDIYLYLSSSTSAFVDIKIKNAGYYQKDSEIIKTDFDNSLTKREKQGNNLFFNYKINGGSNKVYIQTNNSKVFVKKTKKY